MSVPKMAVYHAIFLEFIKNHIHDIVVLGGGERRNAGAITKGIFCLRYSFKDGTVVVLIR